MDWDSPADLVMFISIVVLAYLFFAGFTYERSPASWEGGSYGEPNGRFLAAMVWPVVWTGWLLYRVTMAYPHFREWKQERREKLASARVVKS